MFLKKLQKFDLTYSGWQLAASLMQQVAGYYASTYSGKP